MKPLRTKKALSSDDDGVSIIIEFEADAYERREAIIQNGLGPWQKGDGYNFREPVENAQDVPVLERLCSWRLVGDVEIDGMRALDWLAYHLKDEPLTSESFERMIADLSNPPIYHERLDCLNCGSPLGGTQSWRALGRVFTCVQCGQSWKVKGSCSSPEWFDYYLEKDD